MSLIVLIGAQAAGKMTVGKELEKRLDAKLLFNHQTIDLLRTFLAIVPQHSLCLIKHGSNSSKPLFKMKPIIRQNQSFLRS